MAVGVTSAIGYVIARNIDANADALATALVGAGAMSGRVILDAAKIGGRLGRLFGLVGMVVGAAAGGL